MSSRHRHAADGGPDRSPRAARAAPADPDRAAAVPPRAGRAASGASASRSLLLIIFGAIPGFRDPVSKATARRVSILDAYVPILIAFVLAMLALNVLPAVLAGYREKGILRRLATTPVGPRRVLAAQLIITCRDGRRDAGRAAGGGPDRLPRAAAPTGSAASSWPLALAHRPGAGRHRPVLSPRSRRPGKAANAIGAILFFPMMFFAGLWLPIAAMPAAAAAHQPRHPAGRRACRP